MEKRVSLNIVLLRPKKITLKVGKWDFLFSNDIRTPYLATNVYIYLKRKKNTHRESVIRTDTKMQFFKKKNVLKTLNYHLTHIQMSISCLT